MLLVISTLGEISNVIDSSTSLHPIDRQAMLRMTNAIVKYSF